jgi:hypothetical protein
MISKNWSKYTDQVEYNYNPDLMRPNKDIYGLYFNQNMKKFPIKVVQYSLMSYVMGGAIGLFMMMLPMMGSMQSDIDRKIKYGNFKEFRSQSLAYIGQGFKRNAWMCMRFTVAIGLFNTLIAIIPNTSLRMLDVYGYSVGNILFYWLMPSFVFIRMQHRSLPARLLYSAGIITCYKAFRLAFDKKY